MGKLRPRDLGRLNWSLRAVSGSIGTGTGTQVCVTPEFVICRWLIQWTLLYIRVCAYLWWFLEIKFLHVKWLDQWSILSAKEAGPWGYQAQGRLGWYSNTDNKRLGDNLPAEEWAPSSLFLFNSQTLEVSFIQPTQTRDWSIPLWGNWLAQDKERSTAIDLWWSHE